jgi:hypothetical protein
MTATELLRRDHAVIDRLIDDVIACSDVRQRPDLLQTLTAELETHVQIGEELFYPTLAGLSGVIPETRREHAQLRTLAASIGRREPAAPDFLLKVGELRDAVRRHVAEEETAIFPEADRLDGDVLETMGQRLEERKRELMTSATGRVTKRTA